MRKYFKRRNSVKKLFALILFIALLCFSFGACEKIDDNDMNETGSEDDESENNQSEENEGEENKGEENEGEENEEPLPQFGSDIGDLANSYPLQLVFSDGKSSIKDYRGKVVVVNFWGTWCGPCKSELPHFNQLASEYSDEVVFYMVHSTSNKSTAKGYIETNLPNSEMVFLYDLSLNPSDPYAFDMYYDLLGGIGYYPRTVVIDEKGVITYAQDGVMSYDLLKSKIDDALSKQ